MEPITQTVKSRTSGLIKTILLLTIIVVVIFTYISTKKPPEKKDTSGFSALYSGESKSDGAQVPSKLKWVDSFKGIDNMEDK